MFAATQIFWWGRRSCRLPSSCYNPTMSTPSVYPTQRRVRPQSPRQGMEGYLDLYRRAEQDPEAFWGEIADARDSLVREMVQGARLESALRALVRRARKPTSPTTAWTGTSPRIAKTKSRFCGKASRASSAPSPIRNCIVWCPLRQRAEIARLQGRRPRHHLHADDSGAAHRHAGVRAARHHSQRGVRRIFGGGAEGAHSGPGRDSGDHRRWRLSPRQRGEAEARRR